MAQYKANYKTYIVNTNTTIRQTGFSAISFENIGTDDAVINNVIPCDNTGVARSFEEKPYVIIESNFNLTFAGASTDKRILVVETYYTEI